MKSQWVEADARAMVDRYAADDVNEDIALRVYTSRLIGQDPTLVLHGGGNTSVKTRVADDLGEPIEVLCVKGSGWDLGDIEPEGLPAVRLGSLGALVVIYFVRPLMPRQANPNHRVPLIGSRFSPLIDSESAGIEDIDTHPARPGV